MTLRRTATLALAAVMAAGIGMAEEGSTTPVDRLALPARVRLTLSDGRRESYELLQVRDDAFEIRRPGRLPEPASTLPRTEIRRLELRRSGGGGAWWGALVGGAIGVAACLALNSAEDGPELGFTLPRFALPLTAAGAGIGAVVGRERWEPVDIGRSGTGAGSPGGFHSNSIPGPRASLGWTVRF